MYMYNVHGEAHMGIHSWSAMF